MKGALDAVIFFLPIKEICVLDFPKYSLIKENTTTSDLEFTGERK